jgi:integrase/uncharacterized coiled-coil protein SlyX
VKAFLAFISGRTEDASNIEPLARQYIIDVREGRRDWFKDLLSFAASFQGKPPKTAHTYVSAAKNWIEFSLDVEASRKQLRLLNGRLPKGSRARTEESEINAAILRRIFTHLPLHGKALYLLLASSGIRIGEALQLKLSDVDLMTDPPKITVRAEYTKAGDTYISFISKEAKEVLEEWLKQREQYIRTSKNRGRGLAKTGFGRGVKSDSDGDRLFPFSNVVAEQMWYTALQKAGLTGRDPSTKRRTIHPHMLRKFFQSQMKYANVPEDVVEALIGHSGYLDEAYRRYTKEQIAEAYRKGEPYLLINVPREISEIQTHFQKEMDEMRGQIVDLTRKLTDNNSQLLKLMNEREEIRKEKEEMASKLDALTKRIEAFEAFTKRWLEATPDELEAIGWEIFRRRNNIKTPEEFEDLMSVEKPAAQVEKSTAPKVESPPKTVPFTEPKLEPVEKRLKAKQKEVQKYRYLPTTVLE